LIDILWKINEPEYDCKMIKFAQIGFKNDNIGSIIRLSRMYSDGRGVNKDLVQAYKLLEPIYKKSEWAAYQLFDTLWEMNSADSDRMLYKSISHLIDKNSEKTLLRLSKMYLEGRGVEQSIEMAIDCYSRIPGVSNAKMISLFDSLWGKCKECEAYKLKTILDPLISDGYGEAFLRLAHMYRAGYGVVKNMNASNELLQVAADSGCTRAINELSIFSKNSCDDGDLIIYSTDHYAALSYMIYLRLGVHSKQKAVLIAKVDKYPEVYENLLKYGIFDYILPVCPNTVHFMHGKEKILSYLDDYYCTQLLSIGVIVEKISTIYSNGDLYNTFGIFLKNRGINYHFVETCYLQSKREWYDLSYNQKWVSKDFYELQKKYRVLTSDNTNCFNTVISNSCLNQFEFYEYYDIKELAKTLDDDVKKAVVRSFELIPIDAESIDLVLGNSTGLMLVESHLSKEELPIIYQSLFDLFFKDEHVFFKPHPTVTPEVSDRETYGDCTIIPPKFPMELFRLYHDHINLAVGLKTSSIENNRDMINREISLGFEYLILIDYIFEIDVIGSLANSISCEHVIQSITENNYCLSQMLGGTVSVKYDSYCDYVKLLDDENNVTSIHRDLRENCVVLEINVKKIKDSVYKHYDSVVLYIETLPKDLVKLLNFRYARNFSRMGYLVEAKCIFEQSLESL